MKIGKGKFAKLGKLTFLFFFLKGLLWLIVPALIYYYEVTYG